MRISSTSALSDRLRAFANWARSEWSSADGWPSALLDSFGPPMKLFLGRFDEAHDRPFESFAKGVRGLFEHAADFRPGEPVLPRFEYRPRLLVHQAGHAVQDLLAFRNAVRRERCRSFPHLAIAARDVPAD